MFYISDILCSLRSEKRQVSWQEIIWLRLLGIRQSRVNFFEATSELKFSMAIICHCHYETKFSRLISIFSGPHTIVDSLPHDTRLYPADQTSNSFQSHMSWPADCVITVDTWYIVMQLSLGPWFAVQKHSLWQDRLWNQAAQVTTPVAPSFVTVLKKPPTIYTIIGLLLLRITSILDIFCYEGLGDERI